MRDSLPLQDILWLTSFEAAREEARQKGRLLVVKPLGQGLVFPDCW
jgi:hypothetical protein